VGSPCFGTTLDGTHTAHAHHSRRTSRRAAAPSVVRHTARHHPDGGTAVAGRPWRTAVAEGGQREEANGRRANGRWSREGHDATQLRSTRPQRPQHASAASAASAARERHELASSTSRHERASRHKVGHRQIPLAARRAAVGHISEARRDQARRLVCPTSRGAMEVSASRDGGGAANR
jgi:hypothetical protein